MYYPDKFNHTTTSDTGWGGCCISGIVGIGILNIDNGNFKEGVFFTIKLSHLQTCIVKVGRTTLSIIESGINPMPVKYSERVNVPGTNFWVARSTMIINNCH